MPLPSDSVTVAQPNGTGQGPIVVVEASVYERLAAPFDHVFSDVRGGVSLDYITGEQVVSRLNDVLGVGGWSFKILEHGAHQEADEAWALGELNANIDGVTVTRQQFGSQKLKRSRSSGAPLDLGFDMKGAATDAMKKCASLLGVGLYLSRKKAQPRPVQQQQTSVRPPAPKPQPAVAARPTSVAQRPPDLGPGNRFDCEECGAEVTAKHFDDGTVWMPGQIVERSREQYKKVLCFSDLKKASTKPLISKSGASV